MNDEFLYSIRRSPPSGFANKLKRQLQSQDSQRKGSLRWTALFLIAGASLAGGLLVLDTQHSENAQHPPPRPEMAGEKSPAPADRRVLNGPALVAEDSGADADLVAPSLQTKGAVADNEAPAEQRAPMPEAAAVASSRTSVPGIGGSVIQSQLTALKIAASSLTNLLIRNALDTLGNRMSLEVPEPEVMEATAAFEGLCAAAPVDQLDFVVASRRITGPEFAACRRNGVTRVLEAKLGYQALVLTGNVGRTPMKLSTRDVYLAIARQIPDPADPTTIIANPNVTWDEISRNVEIRSIGLFGPARQSPLRALFESLVLEPGCNSHEHLKELESSDPESHTDLCHSLRADGRYWEVEQTASLIPQHLWAEPDALVLVDYNFYEANRAELGGSAMGGPAPTLASFADGTYPLARPVYLYANMSRIERVAAAQLILRELRFSRGRGENRFGFVRLDEHEYKPQHERKPPILSESDLITARSEPQ